MMRTSTSRSRLSRRAVVTSVRKYRCARRRSITVTRATGAPRPKTSSSPPIAASRVVAIKLKQEQLCRLTVIIVHSPRFARRRYITRDSMMIRVDRASLQSRPAASANRRNYGSRSSIKSSLRMPASIENTCSAHPARIRRTHRYSPTINSSIILRLSHPLTYARLPTRPVFHSYPSIRLRTNLPQFFDLASPGMPNRAAQS